jgi:predicted nucleic acid-binding Zn ribbon protein
MGNLLNAVRRAWAHRKLSRGQCDWCGGIIPDDTPIKDQHTCSELCAERMYESKAI